MNDQQITRSVVQSIVFAMIQSGQIQLSPIDMKVRVNGVASSRDCEVMKNNYFKVISLINGTTSKILAVSQSAQK